MFNLPTANTNVMMDDIIRALSNVEDADGNAFFKTVKELDDIDWDGAWQEGTPACYLEQQPGYNISHSPAAQSFFENVFVTVNLYFVVFINDKSQNVSRVLDDIMFNALWWLETPEAGNPRGLVPSTNSQGGFIWYFKPENRPDNIYDDVRSMPRASRLPDNVFCRKITLPPAYVLFHTFR